MQPASACGFQKLIRQALAWLFAARSSPAQRGRRREPAKALPVGEADIHAADAAIAEEDYATLLAEREACHAVAASTGLDDEFTLKAWAAHRCAGCTSL
jgi:hypothetical protein